MLQKCLSFVEFGFRWRFFKFLISIFVWNKVIAKFHCCEVFIFFKSGWAQGFASAVNLPEKSRRRQYPGVDKFRVVELKRLFAEAYMICIMFPSCVELKLNFPMY